MSVQALEELEARGDYHGLIAAVRDLIAADRRALAEPSVKAFCTRRWCNLFVTEAARDEIAVAAGAKRFSLGKDKRPERQRIAERFLRGPEVRNWHVNMPDGPDIKATTLIFCPGLLTGILPVLAFTRELTALARDTGLHVLCADAHPMRSCAANIDDLSKTIDRGLGLAPDGTPIPLEQAKAPETFILMGYSKGVPDLLTLLAHRPELARRIRCIISWAGAIGGSYTADDIYANIRDMNVEMITERLDALLHMVAPHLRIEGPLRRFAEYDIKGAVRDLTTHEREQFLRRHRADIDQLNIPIFTFSGATSALEVPHFQMRDFLSLSKYDANNDMQLTQRQAELDIPMATALAGLRGHHWDLAYGPFPSRQRLGSPNLDHLFPRQAALMATLRFLTELGLLD